ncbi:dTDP-4-dehydrorhamnose reductase [Mechercharimyces sp. CAU 1602]|uniref:dTDP-4-dehydrorhamnose reductase n=1 Tax=Mechercharimyces sp. CAU 1602 TaxID=2973933 RepID=UPI002163E97F|nr:dTDP-4-dehydrorhamnose reductase [Mechercharimyces sp. CAU 1602]MCS1351122.1 dTDP-4-dehydrorhamnose reductase [Mechercharimyces sp. CAU 1602]
MKIWVTGAEGQLGQEIVRTWNPRFHVQGFGRQQWDVGVKEESTELFRKDAPDILVHCAAYTNVDESEDQPERAYQVNAAGTHHLARLCEDKGTLMVYVSTDYVFDGKQTDGYCENDDPSPLNVYGRSKRAGELSVQSQCSRYVIARTSWLYGRGGNHFVKAILARAKKKKKLRVVTDQVGTPTHVGYVARTLKRLIESNAQGIYHVSSSGACSWFQFAEEIMKQSEMEHVEIEAILAKQLQRRAKRPAVSILRTVRLQEHGLVPAPHWKQGLKDYLSQRGKDDD